MSAWSRLWALLRPDRWLFWLAISLMSLGSVSFLAMPAIVKEMAEIVIREGVDRVGFIHYFLLLGVVALSALLGGVSHLIVYRVSYRVSARARSGYTRRLLECPVEYHRQERIGFLIDGLTSCVGDIEGFIKSSIGGLLMVVIMVVGSAVMMLVLNWKLFILLLFTVLPTTFVLRFVFRRARDLQRESKDVHSELIAHMHSLLYGIEMVKAYNAQERELNRFAVKQDRLVGVLNRNSWFLSVVEPFTMAAAVITFLLFLLYGGSLLASEELSPDALLAFLLYLMIIMPQLRSLSVQLSRWQQVGASLDRLGTVMDAPVETDEEGARPLPVSLEPSIEFRNVDHSYTGREKALQSISFSIAPGERVGIVGESGAGKTTIFNLLLGFYQQQEGQILIGGRNIMQVTRASVREAMALVPQDIVLFDGDVFENVKFGRSSASDEDAREACRAAQAEEFILSMPEQYRTMLGDRGMNLSGGQRQRLAIARAILKNAPILLLDEATSSLDAVTEELLREAMDRAMEGRTTIVIAHRLATVVHLPRIIVLHRGRILDDGTHHELLDRCAAYRTLVATQLISAADS